MQNFKNLLPIAFIKNILAILLLLFTSALTAQSYCSATSDATDLHIKQVSVGGAINNSGAGTYTDFSNIIFDVTASSFVVIRVNVSVTLTGGIYFGVDSNSDGTFEQLPGIYLSGTNSFSVYYQAPVTASGPIRLRVRAGSSTACGHSSGGETEDYTIHLFDRRYVKQGGTGNGLSWANASGDLQGTINNISWGNEVWVAAGTYQPTAGQSFSMRENIKVYGGFPATGNPTMTNRNWRQNVTQLQGNNASVLRNNNNGLTPKAVIDGFTLYNGRSGQGGGIFSYNVSPTLRNLIVRDCNASDEGGGIYVNAGAPQIVNVEIVANTVGWAGDNGTRRGAGFYNYEGGPVLVNVLIANNSAYGNGGLGGGVSLNSGFASFTNATIVNNSAASGAGMYSQNASPQIKNTIIYNNAITTNGGTPNYNHSLIQGSTPWNNAIGNNGGNNIDGNPEFVNPAAGNFTLGLFSPALNTGRNNAFPTTFTSTDLAGNNRIYNNGTIDIGAYELQDIIGPDGGGVFYVRKNATGNGSSWSNALGEVKSALKIAKQYNDATPETVKQIWVSAGTYQPNTGESFAMIEKAKIYGGFAATGSPAMAERNWATNVTTLAGNGNRVISNNNNGLTNLALLDGFTIANGNTADRGAGINNLNAYPLIQNCIFKNNYTTNWGGALCNEGSGSTKIQNCLFYANTGGAGGAAFDFNGSTTTYTNVTFANNSSGGNGNALHTHVNSNSTGYNCIFWGNTGPSGSNELISTPGSSITLNNSLVTNISGNIVGSFTGNSTINSNPQFTDAANGNFTLKLTSPAINTGNTSDFNGAATAKDIAGNSRLFGSSIDMGAYESRAAYPDANGRIYVRKNSTGNGETWATALGEASTALIAAKQFNDAYPARVKEIWVAAGDYQAAAGESFVMVENVKIYGGFPTGGNPSLNDRNWNANSTRLLGNNASVVNNTNNGLTNAAVLDGFTIANGLTSGNGGGINNVNSYPSIINLIVKNNTATNWGGAIFNEGNGSTLIVNTLMHNNSAGGGGATFDFNSAATKYVNVTFANNASSQNGGALHTHVNSNVTGFNCIFWGNTAAAGGSQLYSTAGSGVTLNNALIANNPSAIAGTFTGNAIISTDPLFNNVANADYTLKANSPALNAGNNSYFTDASTSKDLSCNARITRSIIDLGAYENPYVIYPDSDGIIYVRKGGTGNGVSWNDAVGEAVSAFAAAGTLNSTPGTVKEIWVSAGDYQPNYQQEFGMVHNVKIYGGFPATGNPVMGNRDYKTNVTQLLANGRGVFRNPNNLTNAAVLDGFTIANAFGVGAMVNNSSCPLVQNCIFKNNHCTNRGGAINGNSAFAGHSAKYINCLFYGNKSYTGGAVGEFIGSISEYINCTFANNLGDYCSAIYVGSGGSMTLSNCIFWGNGPFSSSSASSLEVGHSGTLVINNTIIKTTPGNIYSNNYTNSNIISLDPQFKDPANGDYTLKGTSPALNTGNSGYFPDAATAKDLTAMPRLFNNGIIDMGPYEYQAMPDCSITTTWNGTGWSNGIPTTNEYAAVIAGNYSSNSDITACSLTVDSGVVTVNTGHNFFVKNMLTVGGGSVTFEDDANLVQEENIANSGNITYKRNSNALHYLDYTLWSSPVSGTQKLKEFSNGTLDERFYVYNTAANAYSNYTSASGIFGSNPNAVTFTKAKGYLIRMPAGLSTTQTSIFNGAFTGVPNNGDISIPLATGGNRFNAVGNPYPSPVNIWSLIDGNNGQLDNGTIYLWRKTNNSTATTYATVTKLAYNANTATGGNTAGTFTGQPATWVLQAGQGFFVKAATTATALSFKNTMRRATNSGPFYRMAQDAVVEDDANTIDMSRIWMDITNPSGAFGQTVLGYTNVTTKQLDYGWDGRFLNDGTISLYTLAENTRLAIQARDAYTPADVVPMGYKATASGSLTIAISEKDGLFQNGQSIYLVDKIAGITHEISASPYTFTTEAGTYDDRFDVVYTNSTLGIEKPVKEDAGIVVYKNDNKLHITSTMTIDDVKVYDMRGRLLYTADALNATQHSIENLNVAQQAIIIQIKTDDGNSYTKKTVY